MPDAPAPVPVTIVTGFLGAGKSTLLNYILTERHGLRIAVIENEFSEDIGIESLILKNGLGGKGSEDFFELSNGCLCCTMRSDLVATLDRLMAQRHRFDYVLIETSGLADPGPVASAFWTDSGGSLALDGIVCVADGARIAAQAREARAQGAINEAAQQLAYADIVLLNKDDTLTPQAREAARAAIAAINPTARVLGSTRCRVDLAALLHQGAFSAARLGALALAQEAAAEPHAAAPGCCAASGGEGGAAGCHAAHAPAPHVHDSGIGTVVLRCAAALDREAFRRWVAALLWGQEGSSAPQRVLRGKGVLALGAASPRKFIFQSVEEYFDLEEAQAGSEGAEWGSGEARESRVLLIGWALDRGALQRGLEACRLAAEA